MAFESIIFGIIVGFIIAYFFLDNRIKSESDNRKRLAGNYIEKFVPFLEGFDYNPADCYFLGKPIDYIIFDGLSDGNIDKIIFLEVKTSKSNLTNRERLIKRAINNNQIVYKIFRIE